MVPISESSKKKDLETRAHAPMRPGIDAPTFYTYEALLEKLSSPTVKSNLIPLPLPFKHPLYLKPHTQPQTPCSLIIKKRRRKKKKKRGCRKHLTFFSQPAPPPSRPVPAWKKKGHLGALFICKFYEFHSPPYYSSVFSYLSFHFLPFLGHDRPKKPFFFF